jgi:hypothetical protein
VHRDYASARADLNDFESQILVPELRDRATYLKSVFQQMKATCRIEELPILLEGPLRKALGPAFKVAGDGAAVVRQYFAETERMIDESYLRPLDEVLSLPAVTDTVALVQFLQKMRYVSESILRSKDALFSFRFQHQLYLTEKKTGQVIVEPPAEHDVILSHFRIALDQLVRCAEAIEGSIKHWSDEVDSTKKPFLEYLAASTNAQTSRRTIWIQILAIVLALSLSAFFLTVRDPFSLARENRELKKEVRELQSTVERQQSLAPPVPAPAPR